MATSDAYAETAAALHLLLTSGHDNLSESHEDLVVAVRARDQVLTNLFHAGVYLIGSADDKVELQTDDMLRHPVRGLTEMLRRSPSSRLEGPSPSDVSLSPPAHPAARAWVAAADATERAALEISRARPEHLTSRATGEWPGPNGVSGLGHYDSVDGPRTIAQASAAILGNHVAWSLTADVAAIAGTVTRLDGELAAELELGARQHQRHSLLSASRRLRSSANDDLRVMSQLVLRMSEAGPLLPAYELRPRIARAAKVTTVWQIGAALDRTIDLLRDAETLTGPQHRHLATSLAGAAHHLSRVLPAQAGAALDAFAMQELLFAAQWTHNSVASVTDGTWQAPTQLAGVSRVIADAAPSWLLAPPDEELLAHLTKSAQRLPTVAREILTNLRAGLENGDYVVASPLLARRFETATATSRAWRAIDANARSLTEATDAAAKALGPAWPRHLAPAGELPRASTVLRETTLATVRPSHPAVSPSHQNRRFPVRGRR